MFLKSNRIRRKKPNKRPVNISLKKKVPKRKWLISLKPISIKQLPQFLSFLRPIQEGDSPKV